MASKLAAHPAAVGGIMLLLDPTSPTLQSESRNALFLTPPTD